MKVEVPVIPIDRSTIKREIPFGVGDEGQLFSVLRKQIYPNPKKTFIQEIMSNARDAHREIGKNDLPIDVQLPTQFNPEIIFRDYGPGISPDRMVNVFVLYGNSTKRDSNKQTGGFGLGAKTPLAYTDSFMITTFIPDAQGNMRRRVYTAYIDETNIGKMAMHDDDDAGVIVQGEKQGTMVKVLCKPGDHKDFAKWVQHTGLLWDSEYIPDSVRPNVIAADFEWQEKTATLSGDKWFCVDADGYGYDKHDPVAVIDGVQYKLSWEHLDMDEFDDDAKKVFRALFYKSLFVFFDTGELPVAATREAIEYTDAAQALLQTRLGEIAENICDLIKEQIADSENLWDANVKWNKVKGSFASIVGSTTWTDKQGVVHKVTGESPRFSNCGVSFLHYTRNWNNKCEFRKAGSEYQTFDISDSSVVVFNDERSKRPNRSRLRTIFEDHDVKKVCVIQWPEDDVKKAEAEKAVNDKHLDLFDIGDITDYDKAELQKNTGTYSGGPVTKIWQFSSGQSNKKQSWHNDLEDQKDLLKNGEGVYVILFNRNAYFASKKDNVKDYHHQIPTDLLSRAAKALGITLYGIGVRHTKKLSSKWIPLEKVMKDKIDELMADPDLPEKFALYGNNVNSSYSASYKFGYVWSSIKDVFEKRLNDKNGKIYKYLSLTAEYNADNTGIDHLLTLTRIYNRFFETDLGPKDTGKTVNLKDHHSAVLSAYPMFASMDCHGNKTKAFYDDMFDYLNAKDVQAKMKDQQIEWSDDNEEEAKAEVA